MEDRDDLRRQPFFRIRLLSTAPEEIPLILQEYADEARAMEKNLVQITWFMRGGADIDQVYMMTPNQRKWALQLIEENIERTNKTGVMMH